MTSLWKRGRELVAEARLRSREKSVGRSLIIDAARIRDTTDSSEEFLELIAQLEAQVIEEELRLGRVVQAAVKVVGHEATVREAELGWIDFVALQKGYQARDLEGWDRNRRVQLWQQCQDEGLRFGKVDRVVRELEDPSGSL